MILHSHNQKETLYFRTIQGYTAKDIAEIKGTTDRNIRKLYEKVLRNIREDIHPVIAFKRKLETQDKYKEIAINQNIYTTPEERKFLSEYKKDKDKP